MDDPLKNKLLLSERKFVLEKPRQLHEVVREGRLKKGLSLERLAEEVGCSAAAISNYERGKTSVGEDVAKKIAEAVGVYVLPNDETGNHLGSSTILKFCPHPGCRSNIRSHNADKFGLHPVMYLADKFDNYCPECGTRLVEQCNNKDCRRLLTEGAFCPGCGKPYVAFDESKAGDIVLGHGWEDNQWTKIERFKEKTRTRRISK